MMSDPSSIWVVAEMDGERLNEVTLEALCDAREQADMIGASVTAIVFGPAREGVASRLGQFGADRLLVAAGTAEHARSAERCARVLMHALDHAAPRLVLFGATSLGRDIASRVAAARRLGLANDCNWVRMSTSGSVEAARVVYGSKLYARVRLTSIPALASLRPGAAGVGKPTPREPEVGTLPSLDATPARVQQLAFVRADPRTVDIAEAERIVAVGRGIGPRERLDLYERLGELLGAALATSRPLVDLNWVPFERQVGQTGRIVSPRLYIAAGISGASHHTLGMKGSECVVAINRDKNAEIFKLADLKVVADLTTLIPALLQQLEAKRAA